MTEGKDAYLVYDVIGEGGRLEPVWNPTAPEQGPGFTRQVAGIHEAGALHQRKRNVRIVIVPEGDPRRGGR